jgi:hypothetical protein
VTRAPSVKTVTPVIGASAFSCLVLAAGPVFAVELVLATVPESVMVTAFHWRAATLNKTGRAA